MTAVTFLVLKASKLKKKIKMLEEIILCDEIINIQKLSSLDF